MTLENGVVKYYDIRRIDRPLHLNGVAYLKQWQGEPFTYLKADRHRMGLMNSASLVFKNHGEINSLGKHRLFGAKTVIFDIVGKEVVTPSSYGHSHLSANK